MKATRNILAALMLLIGSLVANAQPMSYYAMRDNARFLTDRMAYTLGVTSAFIIDDLYRINYDYICGVNDYLDDVALGYRYNDYMAVVYERDRALQMLLGATTWARLVTYDYFYRPIAFANRGWRFSIYAHDSHRNHFYCTAPRHFNDYRGGHFFTGMRPSTHPSFRVAPASNRPSFRIGNIDKARPVNASNQRPNNRQPERTVPARPDNNRNSQTNSGRQPSMGDNNRSSSNIRSSSRSSAATRSGSNSSSVSGRRSSSASTTEAKSASRTGSAGRSTGGRR
ncbi:MAG: hypothetical protein NC206_04490 [Bacteroides sp.]|nr:hypothetical protein [Roseburia sp.]MCM1346322.1 hypothetical protein [Bacteroides sp.]